MNEDDRHLDTVLRALNQIEPDPAMQARLLQRVRSAVAAKSGNDRRQAPWLRWWPTLSSAAPVPALLPVTALLTVVLCALAATLLPYQHSRQRAFRRDHQATFTAQRSDSERNLQPLPVGASPAHAAHEVVRMRLGGFHRSAAATGWKAGGNATRAVQSRVGTRDEHLNATLAASAHVPPPPLPLTEQERLLLKLASLEAPRRLAQLSYDGSDATFQYEKDAVSAFFATPVYTDDSQPAAGAN